MESLVKNPFETAKLDFTDMKGALGAMEGALRRAADAASELDQVLRGAVQKISDLASQMTGMKNVGDKLQQIGKKLDTILTNIPKKSSFLGEMGTSTLIAGIIEVIKIPVSKFFKSALWNETIKSAITTHIPKLASTVATAFMTNATAAAGIMTEIAAATAGIAAALPILGGLLLAGGFLYTINNIIENLRNPKPTGEYEYVYDEKLKKQRSLYRPRQEEKLRNELNNSTFVGVDESKANLLEIDPADKIDPMDLIELDGKKFIRITTVDPADLEGDTWSLKTKMAVLQAIAEGQARKLTKEEAQLRKAAREQIRSLPDGAEIPMELQKTAGLELLIGQQPLEEYSFDKALKEWGGGAKRGLYGLDMSGELHSLLKDVGTGVANGGLYGSGAGLSAAETISPTITTAPGTVDNSREITLYGGLNVHTQANTPQEVADVVMDSLKDLANTYDTSRGYC